MLTLAAILCSGLCSCALATGPVVAPPDAVIEQLPESAKGHVLVKLAQGVRVERDLQGGWKFRSSKATLRTTELASARVLRSIGTSRVAAAFELAPKHAALASSIGLSRWVIVTVPEGSNTQRYARDLAALRGLVERAEVDGVGGGATIPNDTDFWFQYALRNTGQTVNGQAGIVNADIGATEAWDLTTGNDVLIAVLDSGVDAHAEFSARLLPGYNFPDNSTVTTDECSHGTHIAGILAAKGNNGVGVAGLAWNARILPAVIVNGCTGFESDVAEGLVWAVDQGSRLVNMSLQFYTGSTLFHDAVLYAHAQNAIMVAATGNNGNGTVAFPARWDEVIAVAATDNRDARATFSNFGASVDIAAPGVSVWSTISTSSYVLKSGTSQAVPHVTGTIALMKTVNPSLTTAQIRAILTATAKDIAPAGSDQWTGAGRLDAGAAVAAAMPVYDIADLNQDGIVNAQDLAIFLQSWGACGNCDSCLGDFDGNCIVDSPDLTILLSRWNG